MLRARALFLLTCLLVPGTASAQCRLWDLSGKWEALLGETKVADYLEFKSGANSNLSGHAEVENTLLPFPHGGNVTGLTTKDNVQFEIRWDDGKSVVSEKFKGTIGSDGMIKGQASIYALAGTVHIDWISSRAMKCKYKEFG